MDNPDAPSTPVTTMLQEDASAETMIKQEKDTDEEDPDTKCLDETTFSSGPIKSEHVEKDQLDLKAENNETSIKAGNDSGSTKATSKKSKPRKKSTGSKTHLCPDCGKVFNFACDLKQHSYSHGKSSFMCSTCHKGFKSGKALREHLLIHSTDSYECPHCQKKYNQIKYLKRHIKLHNSDNLCEICGKGFENDAKLQEHLLQHEKAQKLYCNDCRRSFKTEDNLGKHRCVGKPRNAEQTCKQCKMASKEMNQDCKEHEYLPHSCTTCYRCFKTELKLGIHMKLHEVGDVSQKNTCPVCEKTFKQKSHFESHMYTHLVKGKPFCCEECGKYFRREHNLKAHKKMHSSDEAIYCEVCGAKFTSHTVLKRHQLTHTLEKAFQCEDCGKGFAQRNNLVAHMRIHTGERPYECDYCDKRFIQGGNKNTHMKRCNKRKLIRSQHE